ncbi:hypothetical protein [Paenirhodobacter sp.]|uniref:hypothetical protein n=1 Tax=Paenirhodobacter sp. TaxID=1965326 RepID=UPI003B3EC92B
MEPMPLPHFLVLLCLVVIAAGVTIWLASQVGVSGAIAAMAVLLAGAVLRLFMKVEP